MTQVCLYQFCIDSPDGRYGVTVRTFDFVVVEPVYGGVRLTAPERLADLACAEVTYTRFIA
jgi:hypothetical protein